MTLRPTWPALALAVLLSAFVALYPYLDSRGFCDHGGCPELAQLSQSSHADSPAAGAMVVLAVSGAVALAAAAASGRRAAEQRRPSEPCLPPESPPPRPFL